MRFLTKLAVAAAAMMGIASACAHAEDFYAGKTIDLILPAEAGGSYGIYGLLLSSYLPKHIPGNPAIVPQYIPGAGGMRASNQVANVAAKDGTAIYMLHQNTATQQLLAPAQAKYDAGKMIPIGIISSMNSVMAVRTDLGINNLSDITQKEVILGSTGRGSYQFIVPTLLNQFMGTKFNIVTTYTGTGETMLAVDRNEIGGMMTSLISLQESRPEWVSGDKGTAKIILQVGETVDPAIPDVPRLAEFAKDDHQAAIFRFLSISNSMARALVFPEGVPDEQVQIIRKAFTDLMNDPEFQKAAAEHKIPLNWSGADELGKIISDTLATPQEIVELTQKYIVE